MCLYAKRVFGEIFLWKSFKGKCFCFKRIFLLFEKFMLCFEKELQKKKLQKKDYKQTFFLTNSQKIKFFLKKMLLFKKYPNKNLYSKKITPNKISPLKMFIIFFSYFFLFYLTQKKNSLKNHLKNKFHAIKLSTKKLNFP